MLVRIEIPVLLHVSLRFIRSAAAHFGANSNPSSLDHIVSLHLSVSGITRRSRLKSQFVDNLNDASLFTLNASRHIGSVSHWVAWPAANFDSLHSTWSSSKCPPQPPGNCTSLNQNPSEQVGGQPQYRYGQPPSLPVQIKIVVC